MSATPSLVTINADRRTRFFTRASRRCSQKSTNAGPAIETSTAIKRKRGRGAAPLQAVRTTS